MLFLIDTNTSYNFFISYLEELLNLYVPYKTNVIRPTKTNLVLWMTKALIKSSKKCKKFYIKSTNNLECKTKYINMVMS